MSLDVKSYRAPVEVTFTFPKGLDEETGYASVTVRELTGSSESRAISRAGQDGGALISELIRESLVQGVRVDGSVFPITTADDSIDRFMAEVGPKGRALLMAAYANVNQPQKDDTASFLGTASAQVR